MPSSSPLRLRKPRTNTLLTLYLLQLQFGNMRPTLTSLVENQCTVGDRTVPLIDVPGHPRLRESIRGKYAKQAKRVVFVIDSKEFKDSSRETAEYAALCDTRSAISQ